MGRDFLFSILLVHLINNLLIFSLELRSSKLEAGCHGVVIDRERFGFEMNILDDFESLKLGFLGHSVQIIHDGLLDIWIGDKSFVVSLVTVIWNHETKYLNSFLLGIQVQDFAIRNDHGQQISLEGVSVDPNLLDIFASNVDSFEIFHTRIKSIQSRLKNSTPRILLEQV